MTTQSIAEEMYEQWLKETNRSGSVITGKSMREFWRWYAEKLMLEDKDISDLPGIDSGQVIQSNPQMIKENKI